MYAIRIVMGEFFSKSMDIMVSEKWYPVWIIIPNIKFCFHGIDSKLDSWLTRHL